MTRETPWLFVAVLLCVLVAPLAPADAQTTAGKVYRIGILSPETLPSELLQALREGLRELGYMEGQNVAIEVGNAGGRPERLGALADELVQRPVDIIVAVNTPAAQAAKKATATIPIVITRVTDPVKTGLVASFARPGGNITGLSNMLEAISAKQLQLLREVLPGLARVAVLWHVGNPGTTVIVDEMGPVSARLGLQLLRRPVQGPADFPGAFEAAVRDGAEALIVVDDALITSHRVDILERAARHALPVVSLYKPIAEAGGLLAYGPNIPDMYRRAAHYVDSILKGAKPGELPIEQPTKFDLYINLKTAKGLGLAIPPTIIQLADEVIE